MPRRLKRITLSKEHSNKEELMTSINSNLLVIEGLRTDIANKETEINNLSFLLADLDSQKSKLEEGIDNLKKDKIQLSLERSAGISELAEISNNKCSIEKEIDKRIELFNTEMRDKSVILDKISKEYDELKEKIYTDNTRLSTIRGEISLINKDKDDILCNIESLRNESVSVRKELSDLNDLVTAKKIEIDGIEKTNLKRVSDLKDEVNTLKNDKMNIREQLSTLRRELELINDNISSSSKSLDEIKFSVSSIMLEKDKLLKLKENLRKHYEKIGLKLDID